MKRITLRDGVQIWEEDGMARFDAPRLSFEAIQDYADKWESSNQNHPRRLEVQRWMEIADRQRGELRTVAQASAAADKWEADLFKCGQGVLRFMPDLTADALAATFEILELTPERRECIPGVIANLESWRVAAKKAGKL